MAELRRLKTIMSFAVDISIPKAVYDAMTDGAVEELCDVLEKDLDVEWRVRQLIETLIKSRVKTEDGVVDVTHSV